MAKKLLKLTTLLSVLLLMLMLTGCPPKVVYYQLTVTTEGNGHVDKDPEPEEKGYLKGTTVELTAVADEGWEFEKWVIGEDENTNNPYTITMDSDKSVEAVFKAEEPPVDQFTLTVAKAGVGDGSVTPAVGPHEYDEGEVVTLTAEADENSVFVKWVVDDVEFEDATVIATMTKDILATAHFDLKPGVLPEIIIEWVGSSLMIIEAPCTSPVNGTGLQYQYKIDDPDKALLSASWSIMKGEEVVHGPISIPAAKFYSFVFANITADMLGENPEGGLYHLAITATSASGEATEKIPFYLHVDEAIIGDYEFSEGIVTYDGQNIVPVGGASSATLEATITLDGKVRVRIVAFTGEEWDCECPDNVILYDAVLTREASSTEKETFELDLTKLKAGVSYTGIQIVLYNEVCGPWPCGVCPDDEETINILFDTEVTLECIPCNCNPCDSCWPEYYEPGLEINGLLFDEVEDFGKFFEVSASVNGTQVPKEQLVYNDGEVSFKISEGMFDPELNGDVNILWNVSTLTGQATELICEDQMDFVDPGVGIELDCFPCDEATKTVSFEFSDDVGLKKVGAKFENVSEVTFDIVPNGKTTKTFVDPSGWFFFDIEAAAKLATVDATVTVDTVGEGQLEEVEYTVFGWAEDTYCNTFEASKTCTLDTTPPNIHFGLECEWCELECKATSTVLAWYIEDAGDILGVLEISEGTINGEEDFILIETKSGTALWEFPGVDCETIVATLAAVDDCMNESEKTFSAEVDNVKPDITLSADSCFDLLECDSTNTILYWEAAGKCDVEVELTVNVGELFIDGEQVSQTGVYATDTLVGEIEWRFGPEPAFDCTYIEATAVAEDDCGNKSMSKVTSENVGVKVDHLKPDAEISVVDYNGDAPSCDASCVYLEWLVEENCLDSVEIWANYPSVTCGSDVPAVEGEYLIFKAVGAELDKYRSSTPAGLEDGSSGRLAYGETIKICLPMIDCDTYIATLTAVDSCDGSTTDYDITHNIDRKAPELEFGWEDGITPTQCATEATLTVSITDGSFPCKICGEGDCQIGLLEWEFRPVGGTIVTGVDLPVFESDLTLDGDTYYGSLYVEAPQGQECGTYVATFTAYDCCCSIGYANKKVSGPVSVYVDTKDPIINDFYFSDKDGVESQEWEACGATNTYLFWDATDTCFTDIEIEVSDGVLVWGNWLTTDATGVVEWRFGEVSGETLIATLTAYDQCNESDAVSLSAYVRNTGPVLWSGTSFRFDAQSDTIVLRFNEEVITDSATAVLYFRTNPDDEWLAMATYSGTGGGIYSGETGDDYVVVEVAECDATNIVGDPEIVLGTQYKLELFDIYASDTECPGKEFYTEPNPIVVEGQGTALSPEL